MQIDPQKIKRYSLDPELSLFSELVEANATLKQMAGGERNEVQKVQIEGVELLTIRGQKGDKGDKGEKGDSIRGPQGERGMVGERGPKGDRGEQGLQGARGFDGVDGEDGSPDSPEEVVIKVNASTRKIQKDRIEGLDDEMRRIEKVASQPRGGGAPGYSLTIQDDGVTVDKYARYINFTGGTVTRSPDGVITIPMGSGSGSGYQVATGTVDGSNTSFSFASAPNVLVIDGVIMRKTETVSGTTNWSGTTSITVLTTPPSDHIYAIG